MVGGADDIPHPFLYDIADVYRYFDATRQAELLYSCVQQTIEQTIQEEVRYPERYDQMKDYLDNYFEMPDKTVALLVRFLEQGNGKLFERAKTEEFSELKTKISTALKKNIERFFLHSNAANTSPFTSAN